MYLISMSSLAYEASIKFTEINQNALEILAVFNTERSRLDK